MVAESFLPHMNGVTNSLLQLIKQYRGEHEIHVIAPGTDTQEVRVDGATLHHVPSIGFPGYPEVRVYTATHLRLTAMFKQINADIVHVASPFVLGHRAIQAARALGLPSVAIYQTDVPSYAHRYGLWWAENILWNHVKSMHNQATVTLAPSNDAIRQLARHGVERVDLWRRGVDLGRFGPQNRSQEWRQRVASGKQIIGYVGRLAAEKQVEDLHVLSNIPGAQLVIIGDGPERITLERALPGALFLGHQTGSELATAMASLDVFVHPGGFETFGQTLQEAMASAVPVVAIGKGGPLELVTNGRNGFLYQPGNLGSLRHHVRALLDDPFMRGAMASAAWGDVQSRDWSALAAQLMDFYEAALLETAGARR